MATEKMRDDLRTIRDNLRLGMSWDELIELLGPPTASRNIADILSAKQLKVVDEDGLTAEETELALWNRPEGVYKLVIKGQKLAEINAYPEAVKKLQIVDSEGRSFFDVAKAGDLAAIRDFLAKGEQVDVRDNAGNTPLLVAVCFGRFEAVKLLIEHGADVNAVCQGGYTPHKMAMRIGNSDIEMLLLKHGAQFDI